MISGADGLKKTIELTEAEYTRLMAVVAAASHVEMNWQDWWAIGDLYRMKNACAELHRTLADLENVDSNPVNG